MERIAQQGRQPLVQRHPGELHENDGLLRGQLHQRRGVDAPLAEGGARFRIKAENGFPFQQGHDGLQLFRRPHKKNLSLIMVERHGIDFVAAQATPQDVQIRHRAIHSGAALPAAKEREKRWNRGYLPMQNDEKTLFSTSSGVSSPVTSARCAAAVSRRTDRQS